MTGDIAGGEALIATTAADCYLCVRMRAMIAAEKKDWTGADKWFADGRAPSAVAAVRGG